MSEKVIDLSIKFKPTDHELSAGLRRFVDALLDDIVIELMKNCRAKETLCNPRQSEISHS